MRRKFRHDKKARHAEVCRRAAESFQQFLHGTDTRVYCEIPG
jgi:hypothetical protein